MKLKEHDIVLLKWAIDMAISEINNEIVTCPNPEACYEELSVLEHRRTRLLMLKERLK